MDFLHISHAGLVLIVACVCAYIYRQEVFRSEQRYLGYWLWACGLWILWYSLKGFGIASAEFDPESPNIWPAFADISLNTINSVFIFAAGYSLSRRARYTHAAMTAIDISLIIFVVTIVNLVMAVVCVQLEFDVLGRTRWVAISSISSSFVAGIVLVFFYHRLSRYDVVTARMGAICLWAFFGYAYLQAWYPYFFLWKRFSLDAIGVSDADSVSTPLYVVACILKIICIILTFKSSRYLPQNNTQLEAEASA